MPSPIDKIAIIGTGVIGSGWTLRLLAKKKEINAPNDMSLSTVGKNL